MFRKMRRIEKQLEKATSEEILINNEYGTLSTIGDNGYPYNIPINYVYINDAIYIHSYKEGHKLDNIKYNPKVCFSIVDYSQVIPGNFETYYESAVVFGDAEQVCGHEKEKVLKSFIYKYSKDYLEEGIKYINALIDETAVIKINIKHITGKKGR